MSDTKVVVPRSDIEAIERAREDLWHMATEWGLTDVQIAQMQGVTSRMWQIAHRNYPKADQ